MHSSRLSILFVLACMLVTPLQAQDLIERYRKARFEVQVRQYLLEKGREAQPEELQHLPTRADTIQQWLDQISENARINAWNQRKRTFEIQEWRLIRKFERVWFLKQFENTLWAYLGTEPLLPVDTTYTRELRARMEAFYGPPTQTISELMGNVAYHRTRDRYIQFEYWFVVNDSIPVVLMDVNGPFERGLIASSDQRYRDILLEVRESLLEEFMDSKRRAPYVDYYFDAILRNWYYVGYNGASYFYEPIGQPNLALGRPWVGVINRLD